MPSYPAAASHVSSPCSCEPIVSSTPVIIWTEQSNYSALSSGLSSPNLGEGVLDWGYDNSDGYACESGKAAEDAARTGQPRTHRGGRGGPHVCPRRARPPPRRCDDRGGGESGAA